MNSLIWSLETWKANQEQLEKITDEIFGDLKKEFI